MEGLQSASRLTIGYTIVYSIAMLNQVVTKNMLIAKHGKSFDRYQAPEMRSADRLLGNLLEWTPIFLGPIWSLSSSQLLSERHVAVAWTYIGLRALYVGLVRSFGVSGNGRNTPLWAATFPAYGCLSYLLFQATSLLLF